MVGIASGSCTLNNIWRGLAPNERDASIKSAGTVNARDRQRIIGGRAKYQSPPRPARVTDAE